jgi:hypothetical protein
MSANHAGSQSSPAAPIDTNVNVQSRPAASTSCTYPGTSTAPSDAPLWSSPFPSGRCFSLRMVRTVSRAHGQCPASNSPSSVRQASTQRNTPVPGDSSGPSKRATHSGFAARAVAAPASDQPASTSG